jgi:hypothetical protein
MSAAAWHRQNRKASLGFSPRVSVSYFCSCHSLITFLLASQASMLRNPFCIEILVAWLGTSCVGGVGMRWPRSSCISLHIIRRSLGTIAQVCHCTYRVTLTMLLTYTLPHTLPHTLTRSLIRDMQFQFGWCNGHTRNASSVASMYHITPHPCAGSSSSTQACEEG